MDTSIEALRRSYRERAMQTTDAYIGVYCCSQAARGECTEHADWPGRMLDYRRAHGLRWDDVPEDMAANWWPQRTPSEPHS